MENRQRKKGGEQLIRPLQDEKGILLQQADIILLTRSLFSTFFPALSASMLGSL